MKNVIHAYGILASPMQLHQELTRLGVSHVLVDDSLRARPQTFDVAVKQPAWPVVVPDLKTFKRYRLDLERQIVFVTASQAELEQTNLRIIRDWRKHVATSLKYATVHMFNPDWEISITDHGVESYVNKVSKISFLNHVQDAIYKITPYDLRKEVQALAIGYLGSTVKASVMKARLKSSYKLEHLYQLMTSGECHLLKQAVASCVSHEGDADKTAKAFGVAAFDIRYVIKSSAKRAI